MEFDVRQDAENRRQMQRFAVRLRELSAGDDRPHDGFVAIDPEGYFLEFERFNPHPENTDLLPRLAATEALFTSIGDRPAELGVQGTVLWLYFDELRRS